MLRRGQGTGPAPTAKFVNDTEWFSTQSGDAVLGYAIFMLHEADQGGWADALEF